MNENEFGKNVARNLNWGLSQIDDAKLARLQVARQRAMDAYREPVAVSGLVTAGGQVVNLLSWVRKPIFWLPALVVAAAAATYVATAPDSGFDDVGELDAKLLTGELPIDAFLDKDFAAWVSESGQ
jgi:hypothetical protein